MRQYRYDEEEQTGDYLFCLRAVCNQRVWSILEDQNKDLGLSATMYFETPFNTYTTVVAGVSHIEKDREADLRRLTLAISILIAEWANRAHTITGGEDGLRVTMGQVLGLFRFDLWGRVAYLYALAVLFVWFLAAWSLVRSPFGRSLDGIRQSPGRMRAVGAPVWWRLVAIYALSGAMAGTAGALSAQTTRFVGLNTLNVLISGIAVVMLVLGGTKRLYGAFIGAAIYVVVQDVAAKINPFYWMFVIGGLLMATVMFLEGGLMEVLDIARRRFRQTFMRAKS
jgi:branched-chain amino acid transport system permease protein